MADLNQEKVCILILDIRASVRLYDFSTRSFFLQKFNADYKENLLRLKNLVLVKFNNDTMIIPKDSEVCKQLSLFKSLNSFETKALFYAASGSDSTSPDRLLKSMTWNIQVYT